MSSQVYSNVQPPFRAAVEHSDGPTVVALMGELDLATAPQLRECMADLVQGGTTDVVVDLADLAFIDSTGLSVLVMSLNHMQAAGGSMAIRNPTLSVTRILEITGLSDVFTVVPAVGSVGSGAV